MWDQLQNILPQVTGKYNFTITLKAIQICQEYRKVAEELLPKDVLKNTFPKSYEDNTLTIGVYNSAWAQQVQMYKHTIQQKINEKFGPVAIKNIKIKVSIDPASEQPQ